MRDVFDIKQYKSHWTHKRAIERMIDTRHEKLDRIDRLDPNHQDSELWFEGCKHYDELKTLFEAYNLSRAVYELSEL